MNNPWNKIPLDDYEKHMKLDSIQQLQAMDEMMYDQFYCYPVSQIMVLGIAGGNGLGHVDPARIQTVYGVDINNNYLAECVKRYPALAHTFVPIQADLLQSYPPLPNAELLIANLLIEYIGYEHFVSTVQIVAPKYVSCIIQLNTDSSFVSDSPYLHVFDCLNAVHHQIEKRTLTSVMRRIGYQQVLETDKGLPNGKKLIRLDYTR